MRVVPWWVWFDSKSEEREFKKVLNNSQTDIEAIGNIIEKYPKLTIDQASGLVENFRKEINKSHENK